MIENTSFENSSELDSNTMKADQRHSLEGMMGMGVASTFHAILMQSSPKIFQVRSSVKEVHYSVNHGNWVGYNSHRDEAKEKPSRPFYLSSCFFYSKTSSKLSHVVVFLSSLRK